MDLFDFDTLPMPYQALYAWDNGVFLASRKTPEHVVNLYHTKKFFVEVHFSLRSEGVDKIRSFTNTAKLEPYLEYIDISKY